ncbi:MAG: MFS transporter [Actinobacteria bacterium HGW-Actinobacteria-4]|nr:MAG: MFS transporter [Actinobacteria bacterium HGW-Actinobacteria-4]
MNLRALWRLQGFRRLAYVRLLSQGGDGMFQVGIFTAFFFDPTRATSAQDIAIAFAIMLTPFTLVGPFVGPLIDRWKRQRIILLGNLVRLVLAVSIVAALVTSAHLAVLYGLALLTLSVNRFLLAAMAAGIPQVVPRHELLIANSVLPTLGTVAAAIGAAIGGVVTFLAPSVSDATLALTALLCAGSAFGLSSWASTLLGRNALGPERTRESLDLVAHVRELISELRGGAVYLRARVTPLHALMVMAAQRLLYGMMFIAAILISRYVLGEEVRPERAVANFTVVLAFAAVGFGLAALVTPTLGARMQRQQWVVTCLLVGAAGQTLLAFSGELWALWGAAVIVSFAVQGGKIAVDTIVQRDTEDYVRGRAFTLYDMAYNVAFISSMAIGAVVLPDTGYSQAVMASLVGVYLIIAVIYARAPRDARELSPR